MLNTQSSFLSGQSNDANTGQTTPKKMNISPAKVNDQIRIEDTKVTSFKRISTIQHSATNKSKMSSPVGKGTSPKKRRHGFFHLNPKEVEKSRESGIAGVFADYDRVESEESDKIFKAYFSSTDDLSMKLFGTMPVFRYIPSRRLT